METIGVEVAQAGHDLSVMGLFLRADIVVKSVMAILAFLSVWTWAIAIEKSLMLKSLQGKAKVFEQEFWSGTSLEALNQRYGHNPNDPFGRVLAAAMRDFSGYAAAKSAGAEANRELTKLEGGLGILAIIGSSAPFIGLLGTVWGIMNSFRSIAATQDTSLAVVAPGIAEALFATALGLVAAIPAVIFFNALSSNLGKYAVKLEGFVDDLSALAARGN
ncbi:MotA/TolQ/ExbB proton channel family protein [Woodsholea maritima]|uniref:MotA/TolQ/ExbB proton channel family protein n=1 Tax=Woodsholea maritima TaxID=240237 RepID=UPI0003619423|nr:MotA/TolQ/ExbB proton channel family protein [Woodsholea maritima]